jgi:hypothetical protein
MPLRAIAYHKAISVDALAEMFKAEWNQLVATTSFIQCPKCGAKFAVFLQQKDDPDNKSYLTDLEKRISEDCCNGKHLSEFRLA